MGWHLTQELAQIHDAPNGQAAGFVLRQRYLSSGSGAAAPSFMAVPVIEHSLVGHHSPSGGPTLVSIICKRPSDCTVEEGRALEMGGIMTLDVQVLVIAFCALSLRLLVERSALDVAEKTAGSHREDQHSRDHDRPEGQARTQPSDYQSQVRTT